MTHRYFKVQSSLENKL